MKSVYDTHIVMMIRSVWRAVCDGISSCNTVYIFVETTYFLDVSEVSTFCCYILLFVLCIRLEMAHNTQMHRRILNYDRIVL